MSIDKIWARPVSRLAFGRQLMPGDDAVGYLSGLAAGNCFPSADAFCGALRLSLNDLRLGKPRVVEQLAIRGGVDRTALLNQLVVHVSGNRAAIGAHYLGVDAIADPAKYMRFCPACLVEDAAREPELRPSALVRQRLSHQFHVFGACPRHHVTIVQVEHDPAHPYDFARRYQQLLEDEDPRLMPAQCYSTALAAFVENRLLSNVDKNPFWTGQTISEIIRSSIAVGAIEHMGCQYALREIDDLPAVAGRGFDAIDGGPETLFPVLDKAIADLKVDVRRSLPGTRALGRFGTLLNTYAATPQFVELRELAGKFLVDRKLVRLNDPLVFGLSRANRTYESLSTLAVQYHTSERLLRQALLAVNLLDPTVVRRVPDSKVFVEVAEVQAFLEVFASRMTKLEVAECLGVDERKVLELVQAGILSAPIIRTSSDRKPLMFFARPAIEGFHRHMLGRACADNRDGLVSSQLASRIVQRPLWTLLRMIHEGKLKRVAAHGTRLDELLVDPNEIANLVRPPPPEAYSVAECNQQLELSPKNVGALLKRGYLPCIMIPRPTGNGSRRAVPKREFAAFRARYISISEMARVYGIGWKGVVARLRKFGIEPRYSSEEVGAPIFDRKEIESFFADDGLLKLRRTFKRNSANWRPPATPLLSHAGQSIKHGYERRSVSVLAVP